MSDKLTNNSEILFRQIHPNSLQNGEPGSDRFRPSEQDENMLSVDRSSLASAMDAHALYTNANRKSAAVFGISVGEFETESIPCMTDPLDETQTEPANPAHALADYSTHSTSKQKLVAKRLKRHAVERGCLYSAPN